MKKIIETLCVIAVCIILPGTNARKVLGNCAVGRGCDHCQKASVKQMRNTFSSDDAPFNICCSNCKNSYFSFNVLWMTFCACWDFSKPIIKGDKTDKGTTSKKDFDVKGNCLYGKNCSSCNRNSVTYSNGLAFCCPKCNADSISVSSINNRHICSCPKQTTESGGINGDCLHGESCTGCNTIAHRYGVAFCCPKCRDYPTSVSSINNHYTCYCPRHSRKDFHIIGNCLYGKNCTRCSNNSVTYSNGVLFCCSNCNDNPMSVTSVNNRHTCSCPQEKHKVAPSIRGNCLYDTDCDGCNNVSIFNNRRFCCPGCSGNMNSFTDNQGTTCNCS